MYFKTGDKVKFSKSYIKYLKGEKFHLYGWEKKALNHIKSNNNKPLKITRVNNTLEVYHIKELDCGYEKEELTLAKNKIKKLE